MGEGDGLLSMDELETALDMLNLEVTPIQLRRLVNVLYEDGNGIHCGNFIRLILMTPKYLELSKQRRALMKLRKDEARLEHRLAKSPIGFLGFFFKWIFATEQSKRIKAAIMVQRAWRRRKENRMLSSLKALNTDNEETKKEIGMEKPTEFQKEIEMMEATHTPKKIETEEAAHTPQKVKETEEEAQIQDKKEVEANNEASNPFSIFFW